MTTTGVADLKGTLTKLEIDHFEFIYLVWECVRIIYTSILFDIPRLKT